MNKTLGFNTKLVVNKNNFSIQPGSIYSVQLKDFDYIEEKRENADSVVKLVLNFTVFNPEGPETITVPQRYTEKQFENYLFKSLCYQIDFEAEELEPNEFLTLLKDIPVLCLINEEESANGKTYLRFEFDSRVLVSA